MDPDPEQLARIDAAYAQTRQQLAKLRRVQSSTGAGLIVVVLGFGLALFLKTQSMYTEEAFEAPLQKQMERLAPEVARSVQHIAQAVQPVYLREVQAHLPEALPALRDVVQNEAHEFSKGVEGLVDKHVADLMRDVQNRQVSRLSKRFPKLDTPEGRKLIDAELKAAFERETADILQHVHDLFIQDLARVQTELDAFVPNRFSGLDRDDLMRQYAHLWLMMLDRGILGLDEGASHGN